MARAKVLAHSLASEGRRDDRLNEIIVRLQNGDVDAFEEFVKCKWEMVSRMASSIAASSMTFVETEDVTQDIFVKIAKTRLRDFDPQRSAVNTWLYRLTHYHILMIRRRHRTAQRVFTTFTDRLSDASFEGNALKIAIARQELEIIARTLDGMTPSWREVILIHANADLSLDEIAELLNIPRGTVRSRLHRGLALLRDAIDRGSKEGNHRQG